MPDVVRIGEPSSTVPTWFLGVDPGVSGGLAAVHRDGSAVATAMPKTELEVWKWMLRFSDLADFHTNEDVGVFACVELVSGWIGNKRAGRDGEDAAESNPGSSMFTFGQSYGGLRMALVGNGIQFEAVRPQAWQKALGLRAADAGELKWKAYLKERAAEMFPMLKVTNKTADALLIASYARTKWGAA